MTLWRNGEEKYGIHCETETGRWRFLGIDFLMSQVLSYKLITPYEEELWTPGLPVPATLLRTHPTRSCGAIGTNGVGVWYALRAIVRHVVLSSNSQRFPESMSCCERVLGSCQVS